jgi:energy-coupling factor transport system permease protein
LWALTLAGCASQTTNPLLLALIGTVAVTVALARRSAAPWALTLRLYVVLAVTVVVIRVGFRVVFGAAGAGLGPVALDLPAWRLPGGALTLFGPVTWDGLYLGLRDGMRLACLILAVGAANVLASPKRVLAALPGALRQVGTAVVVALTVFPSLALSLKRVRRAAALRGPANTKHGAVLRVVFPVLADALDRSLELAASLESRGYGSNARPVSTRRGAGRTVLGCGVLLSAAAGALGVTGGRPAAGWALLAAAVAGAWALLRTLGRDTTVTRLKRDPWGRSDWTVTGCAAALAAGMVFAPVMGGPDALTPSALEWPPLPWPALAGAALAAAPALGGRAAGPPLERVAVTAGGAS